MGPVRCVEPPYHQFGELMLRDLASVRPGSVIVIGVPDPGKFRAPRLRRIVAWIQRRANIAVAIHMPSPTEGEAIRVAMYAHHVGVRAVLLGEEAIRPALWKYLANPLDVASDLAAWIERRRSISSDVVNLVTRIVSEAPNHNGFHSLLAHLDVRPRTLRHILKAAKLPGPSKWYHLGRHLDAQIRLLRDPTLEVTQVALDLGYADSLSFTNRVYRMFGVTAEKARQLLGWEWRFAEWWRRVQHESYPTRQCIAVSDFDFRSPAVHTSRYPFAGR